MPGDNIMYSILNLIMWWYFFILMIAIGGWSKNMASDDGNCNSVLCMTLSRTIVRHKLVLRLAQHGTACSAGWFFCFYYTFCFHCKFVFFFPGGYTVGPKPLIELLRQRSRPYLFSNSLPPPVVACATRAVELLLASSEIAQSMTAKTMRYVVQGINQKNTTSRKFGVFLA